MSDTFTIGSPDAGITVRRQAVAFPWLTAPVEVASVVRVEVPEGQRGQGLARTLYARAHAESCRRWGMPLASALAPSPERVEYWQRLEREGRAVSVVPGVTGTAVWAAPSCDTNPWEASDARG